MPLCLFRFPGLGEIWVKLSSVFLCSLTSLQSMNILAAYKSIFGPPDSGCVLIAGTHDLHNGRKP